MSKVHQKKNAAIVNSKVLYARLFAYAWRYKVYFFVTILATCVLASSNTAFLAMVKEVTDNGLSKQNNTSPFYLPLMLFALMLARGVAGFFSNYGMRIVSRRVVARLRLEAFNKMMLLPVGYYDANATGVLVSKLTFDTERLATSCSTAALNVLRDVLTLLGLVGYMLYLDWRLTLIFATISPLMAWFLSKRAPKLRQNAKNLQLGVGEMTKAAEESIYGQRIVKIFGAQAYENKRFGQTVTHNQALELRSARIAGLNSFTVEILSAIALALVVYYAIGRFTVGDFAAFIGALMMVIAPIKHIASANAEFQIGLAAAQSVFDVIDAEAELNEGDKHILHAKGEITFKNVSLRYEGAEKPALNNVNIHIKSGEKVALVGRSGGGKTTLVNLLPRFYELQQGLILLDGVDIRALELAHLRSHFSLVSQDIILFNDTIFNNIAYGVLRSATEAEVIAAAKAANAWDFIQQLPAGLQNQIGDRGVRLSGGQRQRIAIARAILKNAPILLLDEATSALDTESEQHVQAALDHLMQNRTTIVIAHRLSTIENADRILVMNHGEIVECGTHAQLLAQNGYYTKLYQKEMT